MEYLNNKVFEANIARFKDAKLDKLRYELIIEDLTNARNKNLLTAKQQVYLTICKNFKEAQDQLASDFFKIAEGIIAYRKFSFVDPDDAKQEFVMVCFEKLDRFDPNFVGKTGIKSRAFNFFSTISLNSFRQLYRAANNYNELKHKIRNSQQKSQRRIHKILPKE